MTADETLPGPTPAAKASSQPARGKGGNSEILEALRLLDGQLAAMDARVAGLEGRASGSPPPLPDERPIQGRAATEGLTREEALRHAQSLAGEAPSSRRARPAARPPAPTEEYEDWEDEEPMSGGSGAGVTDQLFQLALLKLMTKLDEKTDTKKKKKITGLAEEDGDDDEESNVQEGFLGLKGAKGTLNVERLKASMEKEPEAFAKKMESLMAKAVDSEKLDESGIRRFEKSMPLGTQRVLGFCTHALIEILILMQKSKPHAAKLLLLQTLSMIETFCLDEDFTLAWKLTHLPQPPWSHRNNLDVTAFRKEHDRSQLQEPVWNSAYLGELQDHQWWQGRRKGLSKGKKDENKKEEA